MTQPHPNVIANNPPVLRCDNEPCLFHHLGICQFHCHQWMPIKYRATHTHAAPSTNFDCDNKICLDYKSKCEGCIPERCNYQKSLKRQKERDRDYIIRERVLDGIESFLDAIEQTATDPGFLDATNTMREHITESLRGGA